MIENDQSSLELSDITFTNLMWVYANSRLGKPKCHSDQTQSLDKDHDTALVTRQSPLHSLLEIIDFEGSLTDQSIKLFTFIESNFPLMVTDRLMHSYLCVFTNHKQHDQALSEYKRLCDSWDLKPNGWIVSLLLNAHVEQKNSSQLRQEWSILMDIKASMSEEQLRLAGLRGRNEKEHFIVFINGIAKYVCVCIITISSLMLYIRLDSDIYRAISLLKTYEDLGHKVSFQDFRTLYQRVVELEEDVLLEKLRVVFKLRTPNEEKMSRQLQSKWHRELLPSKSKSDLDDRDLSDFEPIS
jgi:hypothetical protein